MWSVAIVAIAWTIKHPEDDHIGFAMGFALYVPFGVLMLIVSFICILIRKFGWKELFIVNSSAICYVTFIILMPYVLRLA
jgi:hypothetical protein